VILLIAKGDISIKFFVFSLIFLLLLTNIYAQESCEEALEKLKAENEALKKRIAALEQQKYTYVEAIKKKGKLVVGTSADWPPFEYIDEKGNYAGIDIELAKRIAEKLGVDIEIKDMKFAALIESLKGGLVDIVIADMTPTAGREKEVDFSLPYYFSKGHAVVSLKTTSLSSIEDLYGKKVGVQLGTTQQEWAEKNLAGKVEVIAYNRVYPDMIMVLKRGDIEAIIIGDIIANVLSKKDPALEVKFYVGSATVGAAVAMPQDAEDLKFVVNTVIEELIETGEMDNIFSEEISKWLGI